MKKFLAAALVSSALISVAYANSNAGSILYVCSTPQPNTLARADFEALAWVQVTAMGHMGETGSKTNLLNYNTWDADVIQKSKGLTDAGSPTLEFARIPTDPGQIIMRAIAKLPFNYAFKVVRNDPATIGGTPTILYNRGVVTGPTRPGGKNEDFDLEVFMIGLNQREVVVDPTVGGVAPLCTVAPVITGTAQVANVLTVSTGTFTGDAVIVYSYQWYIGGVAVPGGTSATYAPVVADIGKKATARVAATNAVGSAVGFAAPTANIIA